MDLTFEFPFNRNTTVELPIKEDATDVSLIVNWGDSIPHQYINTEPSLEANRTHTYSFVPYFRNVMFKAIETTTLPSQSGIIATIANNQINYYIDSLLIETLPLRYGGYLQLENGDYKFTDYTGLTNENITTVKISISGKCINDLGRSAFGYGEQTLGGKECLVKLEGDIETIATGITDYDRFFYKSFFNCRVLEYVNLTSSITSMNDNANDYFSHCFFECTMLETVVLPPISNNVICADSYLDYCFYNCYEVDGLSFPKLPDSAIHADFYLRGTCNGCHELESAIVAALPSKVEYATYFMEQTFEDCIVLKYTTPIPEPPDSLNHVEYYLNKTYKGCINLETAVGIPPLPRYYNILDIPLDPNDPDKIFDKGNKDSLSEVSQADRIQYAYYYNNTDHKYYIQIAPNGSPEEWVRAVFRKNTGLDLYADVEYDTYWREDSRYKIEYVNSNILWNYTSYKKYLNFPDTTKSGFYMAAEGTPFETSSEQDIQDIIDKKYDTRYMIKIPITLWEPDTIYNVGEKVYHIETYNGVTELVCYIAIRANKQFDFDVTEINLYDYQNNAPNPYDIVITNNRPYISGVPVLNQPWQYPWPDFSISKTALLMYPNFYTAYPDIDGDGQFQAEELWGIDDAFWLNYQSEFFRDPQCTIPFNRRDIIYPDTILYMKNNSSNSSNSSNNREKSLTPPSGWLALTFSGTDNNQGTHTLTLPIPDEAEASGEVRWGDGSVSSLSPWGRTHYYAQDKQYTIMIRGYIIIAGGTGFSFTTVPDSAQKLIQVEGTMKATIEGARITTLDAYFSTAFEGCENLEKVSLYIPSITEGVSWFEGINLRASNYLSAMFSGCSNLSSFSCNIPAIPEFLIETITMYIPVVQAVPSYILVDEYNGENGAWSGSHYETRYDNQNVDQPYTFTVYHYIRYCSNYMQETFYKCYALTSNIVIPKLSQAVMTAETYLSKTFCSTAIGGGAYIPSLPEEAFCQDYCYRTYANAGITYITRNEDSLYPWEYPWFREPMREYGTQCFANCKQLTSPRYDDIDVMWSIIPPEYTQNQPPEF